MADYGKNAGWRRSAWGLHSGPDGRHRVPATGTFTQFDLVEIDPANPGYIKKAAAGAPIVPGVRGILIQEDGFLGNDGRFVPSVEKAKVKNGNLCAIWTGAGLVMWLKNTAEVTHPDGSVEPARTIVAGTPAVGDLLAWDGVGAYEVAASADEAVGVVTQASAGYVEVALSR